MERDETSEGNSYTSKSYIQALGEGLLLYYVPGRFF